MKYYICLLLFLTPLFNYGFKKNIWPYSFIISSADLIVDGKVSKVSKNEYEFTISEFVKGKSGFKINVSIWEEWLCDPRIKVLAKGQRLILFLKKTENGNYAPINESTGEIYVDNDTFIDIFLPKEMTNPTVLKKGVSMFCKAYYFYGDSDCLNYKSKSYAQCYYLANKSFFEINKIKEGNLFFKYLVDIEFGNRPIDEVPPIFQLLNVNH